MEKLIIRCSECGTEVKPYAYNDAGQWWLYMDCENQHLFEYMYIGWVGDKNEKFTGAQLEKKGFEIV